MVTNLREAKTSLKFILDKSGFMWYNKDTKKGDIYMNEIIMFTSSGRTWRRQLYFEMLELLGYKVAVIRKKDIV